MTRHTLQTAVRAAREGRLAEWVGEFLCDRGSDNAVLAAALAERPHDWFGPLRLPFDDLVRLAGPEDDALCPVEPEDWEDDVESMESQVEDGWEPPPLLVEVRDGALYVQDGNHRYEALTRAGDRDGWVVVWADDRSDAAWFADRYADALAASATSLATSASDDTRS